MAKVGYVYIMGNDRPTLYIGVTSNLTQRVWQHKNDLVDGFCKRYSLHKLLLYEIYENIEVAIEREKQLKRWKRQWKYNLIERSNPDFLDLYDSIKS